MIAKRRDIVANCIRKLKRYRIKKASPIQNKIDEKIKEKRTTRR